MLIPFNEIYNFSVRNGVNITGILHVGAHDCEEKQAYNAYGIPDTNIIWIEGNETLAAGLKNRGITNVYSNLIDEDEKDVTFNITNNGQSSSILQLGTHSSLYPHIIVTETRIQRTTRLDTLFTANNIDMTKHNFWNLDIQGTELRALRSGEKYLKHVDYVYTKANTQETYKGCALLHEIDSYLSEHGFVRIAYVEWGNDGWGDAFYYKMNRGNTLG